MTDLPKKEIFEKVWRNHIEVIVHRWDPSTQPGWLAIMEIVVISNYLLLFKMGAKLVNCMYASISVVVGCVQLRLLST